MPKWVAIRVCHRCELNHSQSCEHGTRLARSGLRCPYCEAACKCASASITVKDIRPHGHRDSRRRGVRELIKSIRDTGVPIATEGDGYWLATNPDDFEAHQRYLHRNGLTHLASESALKHSPATADAQGQLGLF